MALATDIRIFPQKEMFAVDMAEILDTAVVYSGIIQGCNITFDSTAGTLSIATGRILIRGRLCIITDSGELTTPVVSGNDNVTCYLVAACNLSSVTPFSVEIITPATYEEYQQRKADSADTFNSQDGFDFVILGTAIVNPASNKITTWTPSAKVNIKNEMLKTIQRAGGTYLPSGTNINNLSKDMSGWWVYSRSTNAGTFPVSDSYGTIGHVQGTSDSVALQIIRSNSQPNTDRVLYARYKMGATWGAWQRYVSMSLVAIPVAWSWNRLVSHVGIEGCYAYKKGGMLFFKGLVTLDDEIVEAESAQILTISGWHAPVSIMQSVSCRQYGRETATFTMTYDGKLSIRNDTSFSLTLGGSYAFTMSIPCTDGQE